MTACDGVQRRRLLRRLMRHKIASWYRTLTAEDSPGPLEASDVQADGGGLCAVLDGAEAAVMAKSCMIRPSNLFVYVESTNQPVH